MRGYHLHVLSWRKHQPDLNGGTIEVRGRDPTLDCEQHVNNRMMYSCAHNLYHYHVIC